MLSSLHAAQLVTLHKKHLYPYNTYGYLQTAQKLLDPHLSQFLTLQ
jgi:hypothetical protein